MNTWIFEVTGNKAAIYGLSAITGALVLYRKVSVNSYRNGNRRRIHERFLKRIAEEIQLACSTGTNACYQIRASQWDALRIKSYLR